MLCLFSDLSFARSGQDGALFTPQHRGGQCRLQEPALEQRQGSFSSSHFAIPQGSPIVVECGTSLEALPVQGDVEEQLPAAPTWPQPEGSASATVVPESASQDCGDPDD